MEAGARLLLTTAMRDSANQYWGRRSLDFVDAVERMSASEIISRFETEIAACGFSAYIMAGLPSPGSNLPDLTVANGWPREWFDLYTRENFSTVDPVPRHGASTVKAFEWSEAHYDREADPAAHAVMMRAADFGLNAGYCIPLHYDGGGAIISLAGERPDLDPVVKSALQLIGIYAYNRIRTLNRPGRVKKAVLSAREREVLRWAAEGKTSWEIATILCLAERTVKFHMIAASRKLNAVNRTSAVAKALAQGFIKL